MDELAAQELEIHENTAGNIVPTLHSFFGGCVGGLVSLVAGQPFDTIKVRLQTSTKFAGAGDCFRQLLANEGPLALFKGMSSPVLSASLVNAIVFSSYNETMTLMKQEAADSSSSSKATYGQVFVAGSVAGGLQSSVLTPTELVKCRLQIQMTSRRSQGLVQCVQDVYKERGFRGFFAGLGPTLLRDLPAFGCYFSLYEITKDVLESKGRSLWFSSCVAGGLAGCLSWAVVYPIDVIKTTMQTQQGSGPRVGMLKTATSLLEKKGLAVFFRGMSVALLRALPVNCIVFPVYEWTVEFLGDVDTVHSTRRIVKPPAPDSSGGNSSSSSNSGIPAT